MALLTKEQILAADDRAFEDVAVPEWGGQVRVSVMSAGDLDAYESGRFKFVGKEVKPDLVNLRAKLVARCIVDDAGKRIFETADIEKLAAKSGKALDRVFEVAARLNGLTKEAIEAEVKN